jgi:hypothetical protein
MPIEYKPMIKRLALPLLLAVVLLVAWMGYLDSYSHDYLDASIKSTGILFGVVRGINALVSVLQSSEISVMLVSVNIGELLDPLNDLIERFSHVLVIALGALVFQQVMLGMVSHGVFNLVMTALALLVIYSSMLKRLPGHTVLLRALLVTLFLRFALAATVLCASLVDGWFLQAPMAQQTEAMIQLENDLANSRDALTKGPAAADGAQSQQNIEAVQQKQDQLARALDNLAQNIARVEAEIAQLEAQMPWYSRWYSPGWSQELTDRHATLEQLQRQHRLLSTDSEQTASEINASNQALACAQLRAQGKSCGVWDWLDNLKPYERYKNALSTIAASMDVYVENIMDLIVGLLLQSVILPLIFFYAIYRGAGLLWHLPLND